MNLLLLLLFAIDYSFVYSNFHGATADQIK